MSPKEFTKDEFASFMQGLMRCTNEQLSEVKDKLSEAEFKPTELRKQAQKIADEDQKKDFTHLLVDIHEELLRQDRSPDDNLFHANKRLASLTAKAAHESERLATTSLRVAWIALAVAIVLGALQLGIALIDLCQS